MLNKTILTVLAALVLGVPISIASASDYSDAVIGLGPLNYWRLGEGTGTAADLGSNNTPGTYGSDVTQAPGPQMPGFEGDNSGAHFPTGLDSVVNMGNYAPITGADARTFLVWIKPSGVDVVEEIFEYGAPGDMQEQMMSLNPAGQVSFDFYNGGVKTTEFTPPIDEWTFIAGTLPQDGLVSDAMIYINGQPAVIEAGGALPDGVVNTGSSNDFMIGARWGGWEPGDYAGVIDEVAVFDYELTAGQIAGLHAAAVPEPGTLAMLLGGLAVLGWRRRGAV